MKLILVKLLLAAGGRELLAAAARALVPALVAYLRERVEATATPIDDLALDAAVGLLNRADPDVLADLASRPKG